ncbi:MAG: response regulator [Pseudomonadota bacterium]
MKPRLQAFILEDSEDDLRFLLRGFQRHAPDVAFMAFHRAKLLLAELEKIKAEEHGVYPHFILLDLNLPDANGFDVLEQIRREVETMAIPVLVLTTSISQKEIMKAYRMKANAFLSKPQDLTEFDEVTKTISTFWFGLASLPRA